MGSEYYQIRTKMAADLLSGLSGPANHGWHTINNSDRGQKLIGFELCPIYNTNNKAK